MTQEQASSTEQALARILSTAWRAAAATLGPWGHLRPSGVICAPDGSDVAHRLHDPDAVFTAHARGDIPWLLDQLWLEEAARPALQGRLERLAAAIRLANQRRNALTWQGDRLGSFFADGLDRDLARWVGQVIEDAASALDPETRAQGRRHMNGALGCGLGRRLPAERRRPGPATTLSTRLGRGWSAR